MIETDDKGRRPEFARMFDSDMAVYLGAMKRKGDPAHLKVIQDNIALMKKWAAEGKQARLPRGRECLPPITKKADKL